ncbi:MAG TPA: ornithine cyclodeaminase family protein, partial [Candidatus Krumholzibacteria bacterium]|nr:ornithine cyclodeaminase family protein [Candidatus Krumholzibacteria bacterium]
AATAVAAKHLALADSKTVTVCGCGNQGRVSLRALTGVLDLERAYVWDLDYAAAERLAADLGGELAIEIIPVRDFAVAVGRSQVCVTCTPARHSFLQKSHVRPGTFIAAVGADSDDKQELEPALLAGSKVVVDIMEQCAAIGELHHALAEGLMDTHDVHAELGDVIAGKRPGRIAHDDVIVFDSTGTALQDVAAAVIVYDRAIRSGRGTMLDLSA